MSSEQHCLIVQAYQPNFNNQMITVAKFDKLKSDIKLHLIDRELCRELFCSPYMKDNPSWVGTSFYWVGTCGEIPIRLKCILKLNLAKSHLPITFIVGNESIWDFAQDSVIAMICAKFQMDLLTERQTNLSLQHRHLNFLFPSRALYLASLCRQHEQNENYTS